jgi:hypothetical protein
MNEDKVKSSPKFLALFETIGAIFLLLLLFLLVFEKSWHPTPSAQLSYEDTHEEPLTPPIKDLGRTATLTLYESLPDRDDQSGLYHQEMATKKTMRVDLGRPLVPFDFYEAPLKVSSEDTAKLRTLFTASDSFHTDRIKCDFHPDYYLVWQDEGTSHEILLCLTCKQVRFSIAEQKPIYAVVRRHKHDQLIDFMKKYVNQRPPKKTRK